MSWIDIANSIAALIGVVVFGYIFVRVVMIAYYRTRSEYDRGEWKKPNGE
jgi:hypothetical protein